LFLRQVHTTENDEEDTLLVASAEITSSLGSPVATGYNHCNGFFHGFASFLQMPKEIFVDLL